MTQADRFHPAHNGSSRTLARKPHSPRQYLELRFEIASSWFDLASLALEETGCLGLEYRDGSRPGRVYILAYFNGGSPSGSVLERLLPWLRSSGDEPDVQCAKIAEEDWNRLWRATYRPVEISPRLVVLPAWSRRLFPGRLIVRIKPEQAFGTGSHETTRLCLEALEGAELSGKCVADVGTGSGILAIAAARLGAREVYACDPDPTALRNARHNIRLNQVDDRIELALDELKGLPRRRFQIVVANLVLEPLCEGMAALAQGCCPGADLFLSGLLKGQEEQLLPRARRAGLTLVSRRLENHWLLLHLRRGSARHSRPRVAS